jgi:basic amino acid/polyamine antiporter, APA family
MATKLKRELSLLDVFCTATGAMISSGLFVLPGLAHAKAGPAVIASYLLAGLLAMTGMLSQAELVSAMPKAGGTYFFVMRSMGPAVGTVDGLITWLSLSLKTAFALVGMAAFTAMVTTVDVRLIAVGLCCLFLVVNLVGVKEAGRLQVVLVLGLLVILAGYIIRGLPTVEVLHFKPFAPYGMRPVLATAGFVFVSYGGLLKVAAVAEEVKNPARTLPLGMMLSLVTVMVIYTLAVFVASGVTHAAELDVSLTPLSLAAGSFMGRGGVLVLGIAAILAFVSTANAGLMAASRYPLALARDGLLPDVFKRVNARFHTPHVSLIVTALFIMSVLFMKLDMLVKVASGVLMLTFLFSCLCVIIMRESRLQNYRPPFRSPLYPFVQIAGIIGCSFLLYGIGLYALLACAGLVAGGLFLYWFFGRIRATREYALMHIVERLTSRALTDHLLETELKEIIQERDEITKDRFDKLVEECDVLDLEAPMDSEGLFELVSEAMAPRLGLKPPAFLRLMREREAESSTALGPHLAIPHIIVDGDSTFAILLVRCRGGVRFSAESPSVNAVFVLAGSKDERNFHLRSLSAIAQITQSPDFEKHWLRAKNVAGLRDVVLLGERKRHAQPEAGAI